jgi:hypothetical protein
MNARYRSKFDEWGVTVWVRRTCGAFLAAGLVVNLVAITVAWHRRHIAHVDAFIAFAWLLALAGLVILIRLWRAVAGPRLPTADSGAEGSSNQRVWTPTSSDQ